MNKGTRVRKYNRDGRLEVVYLITLGHKFDDYIFNDLLKREI